MASEKNMEKIYTTNNYKQTQKLGKDLAKEILKMSPQKRAIVLSLQGNLGGGKTTFLQGLAKGFGIKEKVLSPTFVIQKRFSLKGLKFKNLYHIDCYRLNSPKDIVELGFKDNLANPLNIIAVEWPEKIKKVLPRETIKISFEFIDENRRKIVFTFPSFTAIIKK